MLAILLALLFVIAFPEIADISGDHAFVFACIPALLAALTWGFWGGLVTWLLVVPASWVIFIIRDIPAVFENDSPFQIPELVTTLLFTVILSYLAELRKDLRGQLAAESRSAEANRIARAQLQATLNASDEAVFLIDREKRFVAANDAADAFIRAVTGKTEFIGRPYDEILSEASAAEAQRLLDATSSGHPVTSEYRDIEIGGRHVHLRITCYPVVDDEGGVEGICAYIADITEDVNTRESRDRELALLNSIIEAMPIPVFYKGADGRYAGCNSLYAHALGVPREDIIGRTLPEIYQVPESEPFVDIDQRLLQEGGSHTFEGPAAFGSYKEENRHIVLGRATFNDEQDNIAGIVGVMTDITTQKAVEQRVREREAMFRTTFDQSPIGAAIVDLDYHLTRVNRRLCEITGYEEEELIALHVERLFHPDDANGAFDIYRRLLDGVDQVAPMNTRYVRKDGAVVWVRRSVRLLRDPDGSPIHFLAMVEDINEQRLAEDRLKQSEENYRVLVENQTDLVVKVDAEGTFLFVSPNYCELFGLSEDELLGRSFLPLVHEDDRDSTLESMRQLYRAPHECYLEQRAMTKHGWRWLAWSDKALLNEDGDVVEIVGVGRDITEAKRTQQALEASELRYHAIFESARDAIIIMKDDLYVECNEQTCLLFQGTRDELLGHSPVRFSPEIQPDGRRSVAAALGYIQATNRGEEQAFEWQHKTVRGELIDTEVSLSPLEINGEPHLLAIVRDVTQRKRHEIELKESQRRLAMLMSNLPGMAYRCHSDKNWTMEFVSEGCLALTGYPDHELVGPEAIPYNEIIHVDDRDMVWEHIQEAIRNRQPFELVYRITTRDGRIKWVWEQGGAVDNPDGSIEGLEGLIIDITQRKEAENELRISDAILRQLPDAIIVADSEGTTTHWLGSAESVFGHTAQEVIGTQPELFADQASHDRFVEMAKTALRQTGALRTEIVARRKDGSTLPIDLTMKAVTDENGWTVAHVGVFRDITERRAAEDLLRESEQKFRLLFESAPIGMVSFTSNGEILDINQTLMTILDLPDRETSQSLELDTLPRLQGTSFVEDVRVSLRTGRPLSNELSCQFEWGGRMYLRYLLTPIRDDNGVLKGLQAMIEDITDRTLNEQELRKLSAAVNQSANAICITDTQGRIEYTNPRFSQVTGYNVMELVGRPTSILKSGKHDDEFYREMWLTISAGQVWTGVVENKRKGGETYWERKSISPIFGEDGRIMNYLAISEDITNELMTQAKLTESEKMAAVGMLAAGVAHEFKNYLGGIIGNASFALEEIPDDDELAHETLEQIIQMGEKANQVAMSLLTYSKTKPDDRSHEDLRTLITNTLSLVEKELRTRSIEIVTYFNEVPLVLISSGKIQQLLLNLIINAEHAISESGVITIALLSDDNFVRLKVGDTGSGISPEHINKVFDPFYSTKGVWGKDKLVGTGMGLSICRNIAREHGGDLTVQTRVGVGTTFTLTLPLRDQQEGTASDNAPSVTAPRMLVFSFDKSIMRDYFEDACAAGIDLMIADSITGIVDDVATVADVALCDARFSGKVELLMFVERCIESNVPYVTVHCGAMEYQLSDIYEHAKANFADLPRFDRIIDRLGLQRAELPSRDVSKKLD
ncbi:PAS domain S-box protein [bacterium]|nr:PAS domain S-box protein [bacterium]